MGYDLETKSMHMHVADLVLDIVIRSPQDEVESMVNAYTPAKVALVEEDASLVTISKGSSPDMTLNSRTSDTFGNSTWSPIRKFRPSFVRQVLCLTSRHFCNIYRNPFVAISHVLGCLIMAVFIGTVFYDTDVDSGGIQVR